MKRSREPEDPLPLSSPGADKSAVPATDDADRPKVVGLDTEGPPAKFIDVDLDPSSGSADGGRGTTTSPPPMITCLLHRDRVEFSHIEAYETHYKKEHLNRCLECRRNFPSPLYLSLHGDECHDPFVAVKRDRGEHTYGCFVEGCERKCASADKRRRHLIDKHSFPKNFFYGITKYGIDGRTSLLDEGFRRWAGPPPQSPTVTHQQQHHHRRKSSVVDGSGGSSNSSELKKVGANGNASPLSAKGAARHRAASTGNGPQRTGEKTGGLAVTDDDEKATGKTIDAMEEDQDKEETSDDDSSDSDSSVDAEQAPDVQMDDLAAAMSAVTFVPRSVRFGRGRKAGFSRR